MSTARHHAEWLSLVETSGPFLSLPVLLRVFPQDLDGREPARAARLRAAYEDWLDRGARSAAVHQAWVRHVLTDLLGYPVHLLAEGQSLPAGLEAQQPLHNETLRPDLALLPRDPTGKVQLLIKTYPPEQNLAKAVAGTSWNATPGTRMMELLHAVDLPLGLITNGEQWMLVHAPRGETTGFASWYADLWMQEPLTLRAFHSLLHLHRFIGVAACDTLSALFVESAKDQQEVTDQLGKQVRQAVEMLVQALDRIDADSQRTLLAGIEERDLYNGALTVMMRLVFLFSAEERELLPLNDRFYAENYAAATLSAYLRERADQHGEEVLERRHDAWSRLLATFRAVHGGVLHDRLQLPAYGGSLFDPDRFPFLEGRAQDTRWRTDAAKPLPINNRVVLHLLEALQFLRIKMPGGGSVERRRLSFRALDIEQIGHVYEGLLDHTARRAAEIVLGLDGKHEPEIALSKLEILAQAGQEKLIEFLSEETGRSPKAIRKSLAVSEPDEFGLQHACHGDMRLVARLRPFADLLRGDTFGRLLVIHPQSVFVTSGTDRRSSGTHYTPRSLTEPIVLHTLEPLLYIGPAEGLPPEQWTLRSPKEILGLKVCDLAMGSGAFLVQTCRYLAERLAEAWERAECDHPGLVLVTPEGELSVASPAERLLPADATERLALARRYVADRCLYGADINPMAVEMAKLSLWLVTLQRDRPFTFLDHALKCGDSLLGVSSVQQIENFSLRPGERQITFATANLFRYVEAASAKRRALEELPSNDHTQIEAKNRLHAEAEAATAKVKAVADCLIAFELTDLDGDSYEQQRIDEAEKVQLLMKRDADAAQNSQSPSINQLSARASEHLRGRRPFHWAVEFPEVFGRGGFDAFVGNPPFMGGQKLTGAFGSDFRDFVVRTIANGRKGSADLSVFFMLRAVQLGREAGNVGLVITSAIAEGDNREVGLEHLDSFRRTVFRAETSKPWPGVATVTYSAVWITTSSWNGQFVLNEKVETGITPYLTPLGKTSGKPFRLAANTGKSFIGHYVLGMGFLMPPAQAEALISKAGKNNDVLFPFLNGAELNATWNSAPTRWVINFRQWPLSNSSKPKGYSGPVAEDYPDCLDIVRRLVKPERDNNKRDRRRERWWLFGDYAPSLEAAMKLEKLLFAISMAAASHISFCRVERGVLLSHTLAVFALDRWAEFGVISCSLHDVWTRVHTSYNLALPRYIHTDCFLTFPFPALNSTLDRLSKGYHDHRFEVMRSRQEGSTDIYNRFHDRGEKAEDIAQLRTLHKEMDRAVAAAYGWSDLDLGHGFHATKQGERYTLSESARRTVLDHLLALNHQRHTEEAAAGLGEKKSKKTRSDTTFRRKTKLPVSVESTRSLPAEFRLSASDPMLYSVGLVVSLLSEAGGSLTWDRLLESFVLATEPSLLVKFADSDDKDLAKAWAGRWNESAKPEMFMPSFRQVAATLAAEGTSERRVFSLKDGPRPHATEDVGYDAWIALRVSALLAPQTLPVPLRQEWTAQAEAFAVA